MPQIIYKTFKPIITDLSLIHMIFKPNLAELDPIYNTFKHDIADINLNIIYLKNKTF